MNDQEAFDKMVRHMRLQGEKCTDETGNCVYRGLDGMKCAVGAIIPDTEYRWEFDNSIESSQIENIIDQIPSLRDVDLDILMEMQYIHDSLPNDRWEANFESIAKSHGLEMPK